MEIAFNFKYLLITGSIVVCLSCVKTEDFEAPSDSCNNNLAANRTVAEIYNNATNTAVKYIDDDTIEGYVVSSDQRGNFFKNIYLQTSDGSMGFTILVDQTDTYTLYSPGSKVLVKLKDKYFEIDNDALRIGDLFIGNFNTENVGRIPYPDYENVLIKSCEVLNEEQLVTQISIDHISNSNLNTLVEFSDVQFADEALGTTLYDPNNDDGSFATNHLIQNSSGSSLIFKTSAFADFAGLTVPAGHGAVRGVLTKFRDEYQLVVRTVDDLRLDSDRVAIVFKNNLFFTELADPNNNAAARFIEIYNGETTPVNLNGWSIRRYTNDNSEFTSSIDLSGNRIEAGQAFVIAAQANEFEAVFGFAPDFAASTGGPADSNGDDQLELVDPEGNVVDVFGVIGEDGSGTNHEFEDGRANRKASVIRGNPVYTFAEWNIWNDTGGSGTAEAPQDAPGNFTPGVR